MTAEDLRAVLDYNQATGVFTWRVTLSNVAPVGTRAGTIYKNGRRYIAIGKRRYFAARLAWLHVHGSWPKQQIDHVNLDRSDDRIRNLREATNALNAANRRALKNNRLGIKGVQRRSTGFYRARIRVNDRLIDLGQFVSAEEASAAYASAARHHFGDFARSA